MSNLNTANKREGRSRLYHIVENDFASTDATKCKLGYIANLICILQFYKLTWNTTQVKQSNRLQFLLSNVYSKVEISRIKPDEEKSKKKKKGKKSRDGDDDDEGNDENDYEYLFLCNRWLAKNEDDGEIVRELVPSTKSGLKRRSTLSGGILFSK